MPVDYIDFTADHSGTYTAPAGSNRALVLTITGETGLGEPILSSVTFGGVEMVQAITDNIITVGVHCIAEIWYLLEADIPGGANSFVFSWNSVPSNGFQYDVGTLEDVNQGTPYIDKDSVSSDTLLTITTPAINVSEGGRIVGVVSCGIDGSYTWNGSYTELSDYPTGGTQTSSSGKAPSAYDDLGVDTVSVTYVPGGVFNRHVLVAVSFIDTVTEWLGNWKCRRKITVAAADVDESVAGFPVRVSISTASGLGADDVSDIFDELGANNLKIAVTLADGETQTFVEVEYWDLGSERAELWVHAVVLSGSDSADLYVYFDCTEADNTAFVGVVGSVSGQSVWDANFVGVYHLAEIAGNYLDSTDNNNDSSVLDIDNRTTAGLITPNSMDLNWSNSDTGIQIPDSLELRVIDHTLEALVNIKAFHASEFPDIIYHREGAGAVPWYSLELTNSPHELRHRWSNQGPGDGHQDTPDASWTTTGWHYIAGTLDGTTAKSYLNDDAVNEDTGVTPAAAGNAALLRIGGEGASSFLDGTIDEVRIHDIARSEAWVAASRLSMLDEFITWGSKELCPNVRHQMVL